MSSSGFVSRTITEYGGGGDRHVEHDAHRDSTEDAARHGAIGILRLLGQVRQGLEADEREERDEGAGDRMSPTREIDWHHGADMQFGRCDQSGDGCCDQAADLQDADRGSQPDALADPVGCD